MSDYTTINDLQALLDLVTDAGTDAVAKIDYDRNLLHCQFTRTVYHNTLSFNIDLSVEMMDAHPVALHDSIIGKLATQAPWALSDNILLATAREKAVADAMRESGYPYPPVRGWLG